MNISRLYFSYSTFYLKMVFYSRGCNQQDTFSSLQCIGLIIQTVFLCRQSFSEINWESIAYIFQIFHLFQKGGYVSGTKLLEPYSWLGVLHGPYTRSLSMSPAKSIRYDWGYFNTLLLFTICCSFWILGSCMPILVLKYPLICQLIFHLSR